MVGTKLAFVGGGHMATAILRVIVNEKLVKPEEIIVSDPLPARREILSGLGVLVTDSNREAVESAALVFLAVKPQVMDSALGEIHNISSSRCFLSIAAGISVGYIKSRLQPGAYVMRAMPNTPVSFARGATVIAKSDDVPHEYYRAVVSIFSKAGEVVFLDEEQMNAVVSLNGTSPAFFFRMADAMVRRAQADGIDPALALRLVAKTMEGAAVMLLESGLSPQALAQQVSSPGGTTLAALSAFDEMGFDGILEEAMQRCLIRAQELGR